MTASRRVDARHFARAVARTCRYVMLIGVVLSGSGQSHALSTDSEQPIEIEADFAELDDEEGTTVYMGNVIVIQGSIRMTGDRLRVNFTPERDLKDAYLEGRLATFKQTPDKGEDVEGEGVMIEYHALENMLYLIDKAKVTQGERLTQGHRINYDTERSIVTVRSSRAGRADKDEQPKETSGRVRIIIPPKKKLPPVAGPAEDDDGDGVIQTEDECPGTPVGTKVNALGCPA